jgi:hypothetical protein
LFLSGMSALNRGNAVGRGAHAPPRAVVGASPTTLRHPKSRHRLVKSDAQRQPARAPVGSTRGRVRSPFVSASFRPKGQRAGMFIVIELPMNFSLAPSDGERVGVRGRNHPPTHDGIVHFETQNGIRRQVALPRFASHSIAALKGRGKRRGILR